MLACYLCGDGGIGVEGVVVARETVEHGLANVGLVLVDLVGGAGRRAVLGLLGLLLAAKAAEAAHKRAAFLMKDEQDETVHNDTLMRTNLRTGLPFLSNRVLSSSRRAPLPLFP